MEFFFSEYKKNYETYTFGYAIYAIQEPHDKLSEIYARGFLPYAGPSEYETDKPVQEIYYSSRSLRVNLDAFTQSSENRRIAKKADPFQIKFTIDPKSAFVDNKHFESFCQKYASERFKGGHLNEKRWNYVFNRSCSTHVFTFSSEDKIIGYVLAGIDDEMLHYYYSFFDTDYLDKFPIGKYLMTTAIEWAKNNKKKYVYLGTCYGPHSLYKARDFKGTEFFDGKGWNADMAILKSWCKSEDEIMDQDRYKTEALKTITP